MPEILYRPAACCPTPRGNNAERPAARGGGGASTASGLWRETMAGNNPFGPNRHGTGTSGWLQRWTAVRKCCVHTTQR